MYIAICRAKFNIDTYLAVVWVLKEVLARVISTFASETNRLINFS